MFPRILMKCKWRFSWLKILIVIFAWKIMIPRILKNFKKKDVILLIPNGCLDAYEVKVNMDIFKYQEKVKLISQFQRFILFFNGFLHSHKIIVKII